MKIAFFSPGWPAANAQNGIATYVEVMTAALARAGHECVIITPRIHGEAPDNVFPVEIPKSKGVMAFIDRLRYALGRSDEVYRRKFIAAVTAALARASKDRDIDFFEIEESFGWAYDLKKTAPCPVLVRTHGPHFAVHFGPFKKKDRIRVAREGKTVETCLAFSSPSPGVMAMVASYYGKVASRRAAIPNPIDFPPEDACWRLEACDPNMILFAGRFDHCKGADLALEMFSNLAARYPSLRLVMAGKDTGLPDGKGGVVRFAEYAERHLEDDVRERVTFLGPVPRDELDRLRKKAFFSLCASRYECLPYAVVEALAMGCPVLTTATFGPREFLKENEELLVAGIEDVEELAAHAASLLDAPQKAAALGAAGRKAAYVHFAPDAVVKNYIAFCESVLRNDAPANAEKGA